MTSEALSGSVALAANVAALTFHGSKANLRTRPNFAIMHLRAAHRSALAAYEVETANLSSEHGAWFDEMMVVVQVSVIMSVAALEANVNETIQDRIDGSAAASLDDGRKKLLNELKTESKGNCLERYCQLAKILGQGPDRGSQPWQNAKLLVTLRNHFMHFKPAWDDERKHHEDLPKDLNKKLPVARPYLAGAFVFPHGYITYRCAQWAVEVALEFAAHFSARAGLSDRFKAQGNDFKLPSSRTQ